MRTWQYVDAQGGLQHSLWWLENNAEIPPHPKPGQVVIEVLAAALNPADYSIPEIWPTLSRLLFSRPITPGLDFCGCISQMSTTDGTSWLEPDQIVFGRLDKPSRFGTLAQYSVAPVSGVVPLPQGVNVEEASGIGICAITAYQSLVPYVKKGDRVFINGGSGGVGVFAIQIAKNLGCNIVVSCSEANSQLCKGLGADETINYRSVDLLSDLKSRGQVFDLVLDLVGTRFDLHRESEHFLKSKGLFVLVAATAESWTGIGNMLKSWLLPTALGGAKRRWKFVLAKNEPGQLTRTASWIAEGTLKPVVDSKYSFEEVPKAFERLKTRRCRGKVIVSVSTAADET